MSSSPTADQEALRDAIARNSALVLSLPSAGMLRHHKSRFLAHDEQGFWIESAPGEGALINELISSAQPCGISFKSGTNKVIFASPALRFEPRYTVNADVVVEALHMRFPETIKSIQRRTNYRVAVPLDTEIRVRVWRVGEQAYLKDRPMAAQEVGPAKLRDISIGGMGVTFEGKDDKPPKISAEDRLRIQFEYQETSLVIEGRLRHPTPPILAPTVRAGVQFKELENDLEGRRSLAALTKIVGELQRAEVRRYRLGITRKTA
ncbi:MAG: flagellar brake protein [Tepidisphaeraceae bacterium]